MENTYQRLCQKFQGDHSSSLVEQLIANYGWTLDKSYSAIAQYIKFLSVVALCQRACQRASSQQNKSICLVPTAEVDCVWETDILRDTAAYISLCRWLCGGTIHHMSEHAMGQAIKHNSLPVTLSNESSAKSAGKGSGKFIDKAAGKAPKNYAANPVTEAAFQNTQALLTEQFGPEATNGNFLPAACGVLITSDKTVRKQPLEDIRLRAFG